MAVVAPPAVGDWRKPFSINELKSWNGSCNDPPDAHSGVKVCSALTYGRHTQGRESRVDRTQLISNVRSNLAGLGRGSLGVPILLLAMLAMMTLPIPPFLLDVLFTFNIALSIVVLLVCVYALRPLDFAVFPTILLVATLLRLALNVASTRVVLLHGHDGHGAAGR